MVDTNIVVDLLERDGRWYDWSRGALTDARLAGSVAASAIVVGELASQGEEALDVVAMLATYSIACLDLDAGVAYRAGRAQLAYRAAGGSREKLLGDFLIGAHAISAGRPLLTRDPRYYRRYFPDLPLITPETDNG
jgi:predicted nucleic acid-binding protein